VRTMGTAGFGTMVLEIDNAQAVQGVKRKLRNPIDADECGV
jgi:hypothetical protein